MEFHKTQLLRLLKTQLDFLGTDVPGQALGSGLGPKVYGHLLANAVDMESPLGKRLHGIPSETTVQERHFLFMLFSEVWKGESDVLEIGPFLGGTTQAIALGMLHNTGRDPMVRYRTYDKFSGYHSRESLMQFLNPLLQSGFLPSETLQHLGDNVSFKAVFDAIHGQREYSGFLIPETGVLPDTADDLSTLENLFDPPKGDYSMVFVDGCKGWYQTKYFLAKMATRTRPGALYIFQDYGWMTCFWIAVMLEILRDHFKLIAFTDNTYAFQLASPLTPQIVDTRIPDQPEYFDKNFYDNAAIVLQSKAYARSDTYGMLFHGLHHAGALAYIGEKEAARKLIEDMQKHPYFASQQDLLNRAAKAPTYNASGPIYL